MSKQFKLIITGLCGFLLIVIFSLLAKYCPAINGYININSNFMDVLGKWLFLISAMVFGLGVWVFFVARIFIPMAMSMNNKNSANAFLFWMFLFKLILSKEQLSAVRDFIAKQNMKG